MALTPLALPIDSSSPHYEFQTTLDGTTYGFEFRWNTRASAWFFSILDSAGNYLLSELRLIVGFPLAERTRNENLPPGILIASDTTGGGADPGLNDLGSRVKLIYFPVDT